MRLDGPPSRVGRRGQAQGQDQNQGLPVDGRGEVELDGPAEGLLVDDEDEQ